jgi:hypothetical protein
MEPRGFAFLPQFAIGRAPIVRFLALCHRRLPPFRRNSAL